MNERIKELAIRAGFPEWSHRTVGIELEDFAELIVRECISQIEEVKSIKAGNAGLVYTQGFDDGMFVAIRTIEEHFGVEE